jgi:hypothetical protein
VGSRDHLVADRQHEASPTISAPSPWPRRLLIVGAIVVIWIVGALVAHAETVTCSTSFQGYSICQGPNGYRSFEWENGGSLYGDDNRGNKWMTIPGQWGDTTINRRDRQ